MNQKIKTAIEARTGALALEYSAILARSQELPGNGESALADQWATYVEGFFNPDAPTQDQADEFAATGLTLAAWWTQVRDIAQAGLPSGIRLREILNTEAEVLGFRANANGPALESLRRYYREHMNQS